MRPDPTQDPAFGLRNRTWGGWFELGHALEAVDAYCYNITTPIILSRAEGARPYYVFSQKINYRTVGGVLDEWFYLNDTPDWMNLVFTVNDGCEVILTQDYCYQRFWELNDNYCLREAGYGGEWNGGGMLIDNCGQFYITAGVELKGYLWNFPLTDMTFDACWQ